MATEVQWCFVYFLPGGWGPGGGGWGDAHLFEKNEQRSPRWIPASIHREQAIQHSTQRCHT